MVSKGYGLGGSCFPLPENLAVSLECGVFVCVVNFTWRMRLGCPALRAMHPQSQGQARCRKCSKRKAGWAGPPRTQQGARGSEALSEDTSFPSRLSLGTLLSAGAGDTLEVLGDLPRCYYRPRAMSSESRGPVSARRWAPLPQTSVWTCRVLESHLLRPGAPPLNLEHPEVAGRCRTPKEATAVRTAYLCARPRCPGASLSLRLPGWA